MTREAAPARQSRPSLTLAQVAEMVGGTPHGDPNTPVTGVAPVDEAGPGDMVLVLAKRFAGEAASSNAGSFLTSEEYADACGRHPRVVVDDPRRAMVRLLRAFHPSPATSPGIHPTAVLGRGVSLGRDVRVAPYAVLDDDVTVGDGCSIGAHAVVGRGAHLGEACVLHPHAVVYPHTQLGDRVILHSGAVIGSDGFGYVFFDGAHQRIPHPGRAVLGDDVEIGANSAVDRGSVGDTVLEAGVKVDNLVQVAHNVRVGAQSMMAALVGVAGSTRIGKGVWLGGQAGVVNHLEIGDGARLAVATKLYRDVPVGETYSGHPGRPHREELKRQALLGRLPKLVARVEALEAELAALRTSQDEEDDAERPG